MENTFPKFKRNTPISLRRMDSFTRKQPYNMDSMDFFYNFSDSLTPLNVALLAKNDGILLAYHL